MSLESRVRKLEGAVGWCDACARNVHVVHENDWQVPPRKSEEPKSCTVCGAKPTVVRILYVERWRELA